MKAPLISIIVAVAENNVIGRDGDMPWKLSSDLKRFKSLTLGKPVIMGRKTFESIGRPLPERPNIVISRGEYVAEGIETAKSIDEAIAIGRSFTSAAENPEICIIGGGQIYQEAIHRADHLYITRVEAAPDGDTHFPEVDGSQWKLVSSENIPAGEKDTAATVFEVYNRR